MAERTFLPALRFEALTRFYDPLVRLTTRERTFKDLLLDQAAVDDAHRVLDLGCGTGTLAIMVKRAARSSEVSGLDADPAMLERARRKADDAGAEVAFEQGFSDELPYPDDSFERVLSTLFFHHLLPEVRRRSLAEVARVLTPGGELHVADWGRPSDPLMRLLSLQIRFGDGDAPTRENLSGGLPSAFERAGLVGVVEGERLRTAFGTLALYRARRAR